MSALGVTNKSAFVTVFVVFVVVGVCNHGNFSLCKKYCVTHRTMLAFCKTCLGACGRYSLVDYFGMTVSLNDFLLYKDLSTLGTLATVGQAGFRTSRGFSCDNSCVDMSTLSVTNKSANVTVFVVFVVVGVCDHRNFCLSKKYCVTYGAVLSFGKACFGTSRSNGFVNYFGVAVSFYIVIYIYIAASTSVSGITSFCTSRSGYCGYM